MEKKHTIVVLQGDQTGQEQLDEPLSVLLNFGDDRNVCAVITGATLAVWDEVG
ncbi:MAG: hypothetical protein JW966_02805 [Anaerolineae bacterium]|nr:hypothetical protein [Anaerolineae bacterium]